ncbi:MAG: hypothetical protein NT034_03890 [Candidatus Magasanikbacteria bacterium]|nr:hypothetical protein [Candidatus Magasanikbacteria bacterium]
MKKLLILGALLLALVTPLTAQAQFGDAMSKLNTVAGKDGAGLNSDVNSLASTIIKGVLSLVGTIFLALSVYAGILWMTAAGNEEKVTKAKDIVTQAVIGLAVTLSAYAITAFVTAKLNGPSTPAPVAEDYCKDAAGICGNIKTAVCADNATYTDANCQTKK